MNRRKFLKMQSAFLAASLAASLPAFSLAAQQWPDIAVVRGAPAEAVKMAVELLGGMEAFVKPGQKVVIKPNMSFNANVESAANTHPLVVKQLVVMCLEAGAASVRVLDHSFHSGQKQLDTSGIPAACNGIAPNICHNLTSSSHYRTSSLANAVEMRQNAIMRDVLEADVLIAAPVAKSHSSTGVSLSLKGQMGLVLDRNSMHSIYNLDTAIVDLCGSLKPDLIVIDAIRVMSTNGPGGPGVILTPGEIIASRDPVAADALAVASYEWYGRKIQPRQVGHLVQAAKRGLGRMDLENLNIRRESV